MEEYLIFRSVLERLESSPFDAALVAGPDDPVVARSIEWTLQFMETFFGPEGIQKLLSGGSPPEWMVELMCADAADALEREWFCRGDLESFLNVMPWTRRLVPRLDAHGKPPTTTRCLLVPGKTHTIPQQSEPIDLREALLRQRDDIIRSALDVRNAPDVIEATRRSRRFWHDMRRLATEDGVPCAAVWRAYTWAKRRQRPWATYLRSEWGVDAMGEAVEPSARLLGNELHCGLLVVALSTKKLAADVLRAISGAFNDPGDVDPCTRAYKATQQTFKNGWVADTAMMKAAPLEAQRAAAGMNLVAHVLTRISLGRSRGSTRVRGRPGKRLDDALHDIWHDDPTIPCARAHDTALIQQVLPLIWSEPSLQEFAQPNDPADPAYEAMLGKIANRVTNRIIRESRARRPQRAGDGRPVTGRRDVTLADDLAMGSPDPLEDLVAREDAESAQRIWEERLEVIHHLPPRQREIAELKLIRGMSHPEVAAHLRLSEGGVKSSWFKAKQNLRRLVEDRQVG